MPMTAEVPLWFASFGESRKINEFPFYICLPQRLTSQPIAHSSRGPNKNVVEGHFFRRLDLLSGTFRCQLKKCKFFLT